MLKKTKLSVIDNKYLGDEPTITKNSSVIDMINAYNWLNYFYTPEDAKGFVIDYLKQQKMDKKIIKNLEEVDPYKLINVGWNCKLLLSGNELPIDIESKMLHKIHTLSSQVQTVVPVVATPLVNVQSNINNKASQIIATLEEQLDILANGETNEFDVQEYFRSVALKAQVAKNIIEYYKPLYAEVFDVIKGKDVELKYAYRSWSKKSLKTYLAFITSIIDSAQVHSATVVKTRKPRKKKVKPASVIVSKVRFKQEDAAFKIKSIKPTEIVGANQLWMFNTKYRTLTVLNAMGSSGLTVKGTTVDGFDEKTSLTKKLRKPELVLASVLDSGKVQLRKVMDNIKCKPKSATGRINSDTIILRAIK